MPEAMTTTTNPSGKSMPDQNLERPTPPGVIAPPEIAPNVHTYIEDGNSLVEFLGLLR